MGPVRTVRINPTLANATSVIALLANRRFKTENETRFVALLQEELQYYIDTLTQRGSAITYTLRYKKDSYTLEEAKNEIENKSSAQNTGI